MEKIGSNKSARATVLTWGMDCRIGWDKPTAHTKFCWLGVSLGRGLSGVCVFSVTFQNSEFSEFRICMRACMITICSSRYMRMLPVTQITVEEWLREMSFHYDLAGFPNPAHLDLFSTGTGTGTTWNFYRPVLPGTSTDWLYYQYRYYRLTDWLYYRLPVLPVYSLVILVTDYRFADWRQTDVSTGTIGTSV